MAKMMTPTIAATTPAMRAVLSLAGPSFGIEITADTVIVVVVAVADVGVVAVADVGIVVVAVVAGTVVVAVVANAVVAAVGAKDAELVDDRVTARFVVASANVLATRHSMAEICAPTSAMRLILAKVNEPEATEGRVATATADALNASSVRASLGENAKTLVRPLTTRTTTSTGTPTCDGMTALVDMSASSLEATQPNGVSTAPVSEPT